MKKTYIIPQTEVLQINVQSPLLDTSDPTARYDSTEYINADVIGVKENMDNDSFWDGIDWDE